MDKKEKIKCMCIDYHTLNKITIKNNYPLPQIDDLFDYLNGACYFNYINLKLGFYQICMDKANVEKMATRTRYSSYEFLVILFGLCNALSIFTTLMNSIFHKIFDEFVNIYIDDILLYSKSIKEHVTHLEFVLQKLKKNKLDTNRVKSEFVSLKMDFLGHVLAWEGEG
jgi:hypothetical protein